MAVLLALAFVLAALLARRMVPEPWASVGRGARAGSRRRRWPPRRRSRRAWPPPRCWPARRCARWRCASARGGATSSWARCCWRCCRGSAGPTPCRGSSWPTRSSPGRCGRTGGWPRSPPGEALAASLLFYATLNDRFYGGLTPRSAGADGLPDLPFGYVDRIPRLASLWLDRDVGLLRWAPVLALVLPRRLAAVPLAPRPARPRRARAARGRGVRAAAARRASWPSSP